MVSGTSSDGRESHDERSRRNVLKQTGAVAAAGALGSLAGCSGQQSEETTEGGQGQEGGGQQTTTQGQQSGGQETTTVNYWAAIPTENPQIANHYRQAYAKYESQNPNQRVHLRTQSFGDITNKLGSAVSAGNAPDLAQAGSASQTFFLQGHSVDHKKYLEETDLLDKWTAGNNRAANFRGQYASGGAVTHQPMQLGLVPKFFKDVGVSDPSELKTWTQFHRALKKINEQFSNVIPFEETGVTGDVESYWSQARTAYTEGKDPWIQNAETLRGGDPTNPEVMVGNSGATDGMIKACVKRANQFSSPKAASRGDEGVRPLMTTGRVASFTYAQGRVQAWKLLKEDVKFGWDGDIYQQPIPKVDPNYGSEIGISELEGVEGEHGGQLLTMEFQDQIFAGGNEEEAFSLLQWMQTSDEFIVPLAGEHFVSVPSNTDKHDTVKSEYGYGGDMPQIQQNIFDSVSDYSSQYIDTGVWDVGGVDQIRWTNIGETLSKAHAGQFSVEETPGVIADAINQTLQEQNQGLQMP